jgi:sugar lactone lactonase YvrE
MGQTANVVGRVDPKTGQAKEYKLKTPHSGPHGITADAQGNIWYTGNNAGLIGKLDPKSGEVTEYPLPDPNARDPHTLTFDRNGVLWFTVQQGNFVGRLDPKTGEIKLVQSPTEKSRPYGIQINSKGVPIFVEFGANKVASIDPQTLQIREWTLPDPAARPRRLAIGPDHRAARAGAGARSSRPARSEPIQHLADGFGGAQGPAEGPLWWKEGGYLLFSDIHNNKRMKYEPGKGVSLFLEPTNRANGLTRDLQGRLSPASTTAAGSPGSNSTAASPSSPTAFRAAAQPAQRRRRQIRRLHLFHRSRGPARPAAAMGFDLLRRLPADPDLGTLSLLVDDFVLPNGLAFSPDEKVLYINDTRRGHIRAFELLPNGTLARQTDRVFADLRGAEPGVPDGMKVDVEGNVYCGGAGGIWIMDPTGKKLGRIVHGARRRPTSPSAATTGRRSTSPAATTSARSR